MTYRELFINEKDTLIFRKELACMIGLNEAIILNQVEYWLRKNEEQGNNFIDGRYWVFNTYEDWKKDNFPFMSTATVKRTFTKLEKSGILISANYNKMAIDRTKWYSISYEKLQETLEIWRLGQSEPSKRSDRAIAKCQSEPSNNHRIPYNTTESNLLYSVESEFDTVRSKELDFDIVKRQIEKELKSLNLGSEENIKVAIDVFRYYYSQYYLHTGKQHTILSTKAMRKVLINLISGSEMMADFELEYDLYVDMIDRHFKKDYGMDIDYSICHFMTEDIRNYLVYEVGY